MGKLSRYPCLEKNLKIKKVEIFKNQQLIKYGGFEKIGAQPYPRFQSSQQSEAKKETCLAQNIVAMSGTMKKLKKKIFAIW